MMERTGGDLDWKQGKWSQTIIVIQLRNRKDMKDVDFTGLGRPGSGNNLKIHTCMKQFANSFHINLKRSQCKD